MKAFLSGLGEWLFCLVFVVIVGPILWAIVLLCFLPFVGPFAWLVGQGMNPLAAMFLTILFVGALANLVCALTGE